MWNGKHLLHKHTSQLVRNTTHTLIQIPQQDDGTKILLGWFCSKKSFVSTGIRNNDFLAHVFLPQHLHLCNQCCTLLIAWTLGDLAKVMKMPTAPLPRACTANRVGLQMVHLQPWGTRTIIFFNFFISIDLNSIFRRISKIASDFYSIFKQEAPLRWSLNASFWAETFYS